MLIRSLPIVVITAIVIAFSTAAFADVAPPSAQAENVDWFYVLRGVFFIFASAIAAVWIGRRLARRSSK